MASNNFNFTCDWRFGFNLHNKSKSTVGYVLFWSGCSGLNLPKDITVWNPFGASLGQTVVSGESIKCIGLIESFTYEGGEEDPIRISCYVSKDVAANIRAKLANPLPSTKTKVVWYIIAYDDDAKNWYEAALIKDSAKAEANVDTTKGQVQMFISNEATRIAETLEIKVYKFEFQIVPAAGVTTNLEFATGAYQRIVKQWGEASLAKYLIVFSGVLFR